MFNGGNISRKNCNFLQIIEFFTNQNILLTASYYAPIVPIYYASYLLHIRPKLWKLCKSQCTYQVQTMPEQNLLFAKLNFQNSFILFDIERKIHVFHREWGQNPLPPFVSWNLQRIILDTLHGNIQPIVITKPKR